MPSESYFARCGLSPLNFDCRLAPPFTPAHFPVSSALPFRTWPEDGGSEFCRYSGAVTESTELPEEIAYLQSTPVEQVLGNHIFVLLQLCAVHLAATPPNLPSAQLVIDLLVAMLDTGGERLGEHLPLYRSALAETQQAFARTVVQQQG